MSATVTIGSLFSGYGGLDLGVELALGHTRTAWVSDVEPGPCAILAKRYEGIPNLGNVTRIDWDSVEPVDVICGGSPCQDLSLAGRRAGMHDGTRSGLWESMLAGISAIRPQLVIWENVRGALSASAHSNMESEKGYMGDRTNRPSLRALGRVLGDLAGIGYDAQWTSIRASDIGAPHRRERVFIVAHPESKPWCIQHGNDAVAGHADSATFSQWRQPTTGEEKSRRTWTDAGRPDRTPVVLPTPTARDVKDNRIARNPNRPNDTDTLSRALTLLPTPTAERPDGRKSSGFREGRANFHDIIKHDQFGQYAPAIARWEAALGREAPAPTEPGRTGQRLSAAFVEWLMGLPAGWVTGVEIPRTQQLRALGNGVVPQQAAQAITELITIATQALEAA